MDVCELTEGRNLRRAKKKAPKETLGAWFSWWAV